MTPSAVAAAIWEENGGRSGSVSAYHCGDVLRAAQAGGRFVSHQGGLRRPDRRESELDLPAPQAPRSAGLRRRRARDPVLRLLGRRAKRREHGNVEVDRPRADGAAAGHRDVRRADAGDERRKDEEAGAGSADLGGGGDGGEFIRRALREAGQSVADSHACPRTAAASGAGLSGPEASMTMTDWSAGSGRWTAAPTDRRTSSMAWTSAMSGTRRSVTGERQRRLAASSGRTAFLPPLISANPLSRATPSTCGEESARRPAPPSPAQDFLLSPAHRKGVLQVQQPALVAETLGERVGAGRTSRTSLLSVPCHSDLSAPPETTPGEETSRDCAHGTGLCLLLDLTSRSCCGRSGRAVWFGIAACNIADSLYSIVSSGPTGFNAHCHSGSVTRRGCALQKAFSCSSRHTSGKLERRPLVARTDNTPRAPSDAARSLLLSYCPNSSHSLLSSAEDERHCYCFTTDFCASCEKKTQ